MKKMKQQKVRLVDLAAYCDVSMSTASRALSGTPGVRPELREKVLAAAKTLNYYTPTSIAGAKVVVAASAVAMLDHQRQQFTTYVLEGIRKRADILGAEIVTRPIANLNEEQTLLEQAMQDDDIAGLLFITMDDETMLAQTRGFSKPVILVNGDDPSMELSSITPCNRAAAASATSYLGEKGHEKILFMAHRGRRTIERRLEGWRDRIVGKGFIDWKSLLVDVEDWTPEAARRAICDHIEAKGQDFTAVLCAGDSLAFGAIMGLMDKGLKVPDDVSVVGMDGLPQGEFASPPLTSVHIPMQEIGMQAIDMLRDQLVEPDRLAKRVELYCKLVPRESDAPCKKAGKAKTSPKKSQ
ncbi:LacI family DNA-binding transcriptional regulator [Cohaesibacter celericrescens]|uniref:LacI family transcriptional regulator n=1 Tax=Cohaesibacter celericrescens TaxID=2067669 RepID=A0A2N5XPR9_9HYPH|nr:LacI family DNA-binding transcriptional regulator [Cohaesibacter celericrescens]PLW76519.1 LacI family transcriptional regulator [Cohaesibacter celericrescens]